MTRKRKRINGFASWVPAGEHRTYLRMRVRYEFGKNAWGFSGRERERLIADFNAKHAPRRKKNSNRKKRR